MPEHIKTQYSYILNTLTPTPTPAPAQQSHTCDQTCIVIHLHSEPCREVWNGSVVHRSPEPTKKKRQVGRQAWACAEVGRLMVTAMWWKGQKHEFQPCLCCIINMHLVLMCWALSSALYIPSFHSLATRIYGNSSPTSPQSPWVRKCIWGHQVPAHVPQVKGKEGSHWRWRPVQMRRDSKPQKGILSLSTFYESTRMPPPWPLPSFSTGSYCFLAGSTWSLFFL